MMRLCNLMNKDTSISYDAKRIHIENLYKIVECCENMIDCRRGIQLNYIGETFQSSQCLVDRTTTCDNCLNASQPATMYKTIDATPKCLQVARAVNDLCGTPECFTLLHMVDVFMGRKLKTVIEHRHDQTEYHGVLSKWSRNDIQRLLHKMVIEEYLREEIIFVRNISRAYLRIGMKFDTLVNGNAKIEFAIENKLTKAAKSTDNVPASGGSAAAGAIESDTRIVSLKARCSNALLEKCCALATERRVTIASIMNNQAIKQMADRMPETEADMLTIPHVTKAHVELLVITQRYAAERQCIIMDMDEE